MEKQFQEVFPDLRIEGGMAELLDTVEVSRVSINKKKDLLRCRGERAHMQKCRWKK